MPLKFFIFLLLTLLSMNQALFGADADTMKKEISNLDLQIEYMKVKIKNANSNSASYKKKIESKQEEIEELQNKVNTINENIERANMGLSAIEKDSANCKSRIIAMLVKYRARLVQLHKIKQGTLIGSVFAAKDINSFLNRYEMVKYLLANDKEMIERLREEEQKHKKLRAKLRTQIARCEELKTGLAETESKLNAQKKSLNAMLSTLLLEKKLFLKKQQSYAKERTQLEKSLKALNKTVEGAISKGDVAIEEPKKNIASDNKKEDAKKAQTKVAVSSTDVPNVKGEKLPDDATEAAKLMSFVWPIPKEARGEIIEINEDKAYALAIKVVKDTEISAIADGRVIYKGSINGLGDVVIIKHDRAFSSVYARLDNIWVGIGNKLQKGDILGKIAANGDSSTLHFEIRFGSKKQKPLDFLPE